MKKQLLTLTLSVLSISLNAQVPNYVSTNGLVAYYPFNGNANDESINTNDGTVIGAQLTTDRNSQPNSAYNFDYTAWTWGAGGNEIFIPYNSMFNSTNLTVSAWCQPISTGYLNQNMVIINRFQFGYDNPSGEAWQVLLNPDNIETITAVIQEDQTVVYNQGPSLIMGAWSHIVLTFDGFEIKQFINGQLVDTDVNASFLLNIDGVSGISIGVSDQANGHWGPFDGKIDDIGIWNRALSECEIQDLYNSQLNTIASSVTLNVATLTADFIGASYQWLDCDNNNAQIIGEINQSFTPSAQTGNYSVEITMNGCVDTSTCYIVDYTSINELNSNSTKKLLKIVDFMGREISYKKNTPMIFIYEDGTVERVIEVE